MKKLLLAVVFFNFVPVFSQIQLDTTFGDNGFTLPIATTENAKASCLLQPDGKIVLAGRRINNSESESFVARYYANGSLDTTFGVNGFFIFDFLTQVTDDPNGPDIYLLADGGIVCVNTNTTNTYIIKLDSSGVRVPNWEMGMMELNQPAYLDAQEKLYTATTISPTNTLIVKYDMATGSADPTFGSSGFLFTPPFHDLYRPLADGFLVGIYTTDTNSGTYYYSLQKLLPNGFPDITFGTMGSIPLFWGDTPAELESVNHQLVLDNAGNIYVSQNRTLDQFSRIFKYNSNGQPQAGFGQNGMMTMPSNFLRNDFKFIDGKLYVAGRLSYTEGHDLALFCYKTDGWPDFQFDPDGFYIEALNTYDEYAQAFNLAPDGSIYVSGIYQDGPDQQAFIAHYISGSLGIHSDQEKNTFSYTNPIQNELRIETAEDVQSIALYSIDGRFIDRCEGAILSTVHLPQGMYVAKVLVNNGVRMVKVIKK